MAGIPRHPDLLDRLKQQNRTVGRMQIAKPPRNTENFIMDPVVVRAFPPAFAAYRGSIIGVLARLGSGSATGTMNLVRLDPPADDPNPVVLHTFTIPGDGVVQWTDLEEPVDVEIGDYYYPEITSGSGTDLTLAFMMSN